MQKTIHISALLKDNMIIAWYVGPNKREIPSDYYKDFLYADYPLVDCENKFDVKCIAVSFEYNDDEESTRTNNYIHEVISKNFYKQWKIHPEHWGIPAY